MALCIMPLDFSLTSEIPSEQGISGCKSPAGVKSELGEISVLNVTFCYEFHKSHSLLHMWSYYIYFLKVNYSTDDVAVNWQTI